MIRRRFFDVLESAGGFLEVVTYTGNGSIQSITSLDFQPDLVWIKQRNGTGRNVLTDSVRGAEKILYSELTVGETIYAGRGLTSFDSNGFTVDDTGVLNYSVNDSGNTYVAWAWKAGGAEVPNTDGSITSQVSANQSAGFSIVAYTGNGSAGATIGHGLNLAPELIIQKNRDEAQSWIVNADVIGKSNVLTLDNSNPFLSRPNQYYYAWDSSTLTTGSDIHTNGLNDKIIAYCFHSVVGYQKVGSYTGTGGSSVNTISFGFSPRFVMIKRTNSTGGWRMYDVARDTGTLPFRINHSLRADRNDAEYDGTNDPNGYMSFTDDGIEFSTNEINPDLNASGGTYMYLAIK